MYTQLTLEHFVHPRNVGIIEGADGHAYVESAVHDDILELYIRVEDGHIADLKYRVHGCAAAIAAASKASELLRGRTLEEAFALTGDEISAALGGLPESKLRCSVLAPRAIREAVEDYWRQKSLVGPGTGA